jgi:hypothetical protein
MGDDLLLLAIHPARRRIRVADRIPYALRAAELVELTLRGRTGLAAGRITVLDAARTEDRRLNNTLYALAGKPPTLGDWLRKTPRGFAQEYLSRLEDQRTVRVRRRGPRGRLPRPQILWVDPERHQAVRARLDEVVRDPESVRVGEADRALATLVHACGLGDRLYRGLRGRGARKRLARIAGGSRIARDAQAASLAPDQELAEVISHAADHLTRELRSELTDMYTSTVDGPGSSGWGHYGSHDGGHHGGFGGDGSDN